MNGYNSNYFNRSSMGSIRKSIQNMVLETYTLGNAPTAAERESARRNAERARARKSGQPDPVYTNTPHEAVGSTPRTDIPPSITVDPTTNKPSFNISPGQKAQAEANRKAMELAREVDRNPTKPSFGVGTGSYGQPTITGGSYVNPNSAEGRLRDQGWTPGSDGKLTPPDPEKDESGRYLNTPTGRAAAMRDAKADTQRQYNALKDASKGLSNSNYRDSGKISVPPGPSLLDPYGSKFQPSPSREISDSIRAPEPEQRPNLGLGTPSPQNKSTKSERITPYWERPPMVGPPRPLAPMYIPPSERVGGPPLGPPGLGAAQVRAAAPILAGGGIRGRTKIKPIVRPTNPRMFER
jgi:hypothetical protein